MASPIANSWANATVLIETGAGGGGTGFFVGRSISPDQWKLFIVTNKHVLSDDASVRKSMREVKLHINVEKNGTLVGETTDYPLMDASGSWVREHPDANTDVLAINAVPLFSVRKDIRNQFVPEAMFATAAKRAELDITAGEEIMVIGYPSGIRQGKTNHPLIRQGIIATRIGEELHEEVQQPNGQIGVRISRAFLVDGATIPGSSGSPVVLKPVTGRYQHGTIVMGSTIPVLLGIIAETRFAPIKLKWGAIPGFAGLGLAFDVETIVETLNLF